jgi:hypothetical protein
MINQAILEQRLEDLERAVSDLQQRLAGAASRGWLGQVTGSISDEPAFFEALEFGRTFCRSDRMKSSG